MALVAEGHKGRVYLSPIDELEDMARGLRPTWQPDVEFFPHALGFRVGNYGLTRWSDLFTARQLTALSTLAELVQVAREGVRAAAVTSGVSDDGVGLSDEGTGASAYADAVAVYLGLFGERRC